MYYIYRITNLVNGKTYIGQHKYKKLDDNYMGSGKLLWRSYNKYGIENFKKDILVFGVVRKNFINLLEKEYIKFYRSIGKAEYNIANGGDGGSTNKGMHFSEEARKHMSEARKGIKFSEEHKKKLSERMKGDQRNKGRHHTEESRKHMSEAHKGKHLSEETRRKMSEVFKRRHWFNNGVKNTMAETCPEGFVPGRLK